MVNGWSQGTVNGTFRLLLDGKQVSELTNKVAGVDWRAWQDSTPGLAELPAGDHALSLVTDSYGPNLYALKLAPEGVQLTVPQGAVSLCEADSNSAVQVTDDYAVQFNITVPFDYITIAAPGYSNNKGSLRPELFRWADNYTAVSKCNRNNIDAWSDRVDNGAFPAMELPPH